MELVWQSRGCHTSAGNVPRVCGDVPVSPVVDLPNGSVLYQVDYRPSSAKLIPVGGKQCYRKSGWQV